MPKHVDEDHTKKQSFDHLPSAVENDSQESSALMQNVLGQFLGIVGMALVKYDLPTKPTNYWHVLSWLSWHLLAESYICQ